MTAFWLVATALLLLALGLVVPTLLRRDRESGDSKPLTRNFSDHAVTALVLLAVPALALGLYYRLGSVHSLTIAAPPEQIAAADDGKLPPVEVLVEQLEQRMTQTPDDPRGWQMLGQTYIAMGRYADARDAYGKALQLVGDQPTLMMRYAEAIARANDGNLSGEPTELIDKALTLEPNNPDALWLGGLAAYQRGDGETTLSQWRQLLAMQAPGSESASTLKEHIARAERTFLAGADTPDAGTEAGTGNLMDAASAASIQASVSVDPALVEQITPSDILFIYARAAQGPKMPLALVRRTAGELPLTVRLDDSMAMIPDMKLSAFAEVEVVARVSRAGSATPRSGDLTGSSEILAVGGTQVTDVVISAVVE